MYDVLCTMLPASLEDLTFAQSGVGPLEAGGEDLADVGEVEEEQRHAHHRVEDGHDLADGRHRHDVAVTCNTGTLDIVIIISNISVYSSYTLSVLYSRYPLSMIQDSRTVTQRKQTASPFSPSLRHDESQDGVDDIETQHPRSNAAHKLDILLLFCPTSQEQ